MVNKVLWSASGYVQGAHRGTRSMGGRWSHMQEEMKFLLPVGEW